MPADILELDDAWADEMAARIVTDAYRPDARAIIATKLKLVERMGLMRGLLLSETAILELFRRERIGAGDDHD